MSTSLPPCCTLPPDDAPIEAAGYAAYNAGGDPETAGLTFQGRPCPEWDGLTPNVRAKWKAGRQEMARRIVAHIRAEAGPHDGCTEVLYWNSVDWDALLVELTED